MSGTIYNPYNLPGSGTYLAEQKFNITGLLSGTMYSLGVKDPVTNVTHNLKLTAVYQEYTSPKLVINYINSEVLNTTIQVSGARSIPIQDVEGKGLNPNVIYQEQTPDNWVGNVEWGSYNRPKIRAGSVHSLALTNTGKITGWGSNTYGQLDIPRSLSGVTAIATGLRHSVALTNTGKLTAWGQNLFGQLNIPPNLTGVTSVAVGQNHSLALTNTGLLTGWGQNTYGQLNVPPDLTGVTAIAVGSFHSLALTNTGVVSGWGAPFFAHAPAGLSGVTAIAAGDRHSLALTDTGTVTGWGMNQYGQLDIPPQLSGVTAIAAGQRHSVALTDKGTVIAWGDTGYGQTDVPPALTGVASIDAGVHYCLALTYTGLVTGWGSNEFGELNIPHSLYSSGSMIVRTADNYGASIYYDPDTSRWILRSLRNVMIEQSDVVSSSATKPWEVNWSDMNADGFSTLILLPLSGINNNGGISLTFSSNEILTSQKVSITLNNGTDVVTLTGLRDTPIIFSRLNSELIDNNDLILTDEGRNRTWNLKAHIGLGRDASYIKHNDNAYYQTGDTIIFPYNEANRPSKGRIEYKNKIYNEGDTLHLS
jgi:hypothetical protein